MHITQRQANVECCLDEFGRKNWKTGHLGRELGARSLLLSDFFTENSPSWQLFTNQQSDASRWSFDRTAAALNHSASLHSGSASSYASPHAPEPSQPAMLLSVHQFSSSLYSVSYYINTPSRFRPRKSLQCFFFHCLLLVLSNIQYSTTDAPPYTDNEPAGSAKTDGDIVFDLKWN